MQVRELVTMVGRKRFMALAVLIIIGGVLGGAWQKWFIPQFEQLTTEKNSVQSDRSRLQQDIRDLPSKYAELHANEDRYDKLVTGGFTSQQDRILARTNMDNLRVETGVRGLTYDISPQEKIDHPQSYALNMDLAKSEIKVKLKGLSDIEMRDFIERIQQNFSGLVVADRLMLTHKEELNETNLTQLSKKIPVDFVEGEATFKWYNLVPKEINVNAPEAQAFGGQSQ